MFSSRLPPSVDSNRLTRALAGARRAGRPVLDLTQSNPTQAGLAYPPDLLASLAGARSLRYDPEPLGLREAREAVAADYARQGLSVSPDRIVLTASSSDSYSELFKLLADPGDEILVPRPSYPLFEHLARLDGVMVRPYDLEYHGRWSVDVGGLARRFTARTRALLVVSPNNPTGSFIKADELDRIAALAAAHDAAIVADEVFVDYELEAGARAAAGRPLGRTDVVTFALGGLSKSVGLPQLKLGWIAVGGPPGPVRAALDRLEFINDTYLSASTPVQLAASTLLSRGTSVRTAIHARILANHGALVERASAAPSCGTLHVEGGWYAVVQVPRIRSEEEIVLDLLESDGVLVHPGYFFDFAGEAFLVVSLLAREAVFAEGIERLLRRVAV